LHNHRDQTPTPAWALAYATQYRSLDRLGAWLTAEGWTLHQLPLAGMCEGYTDHERRIIAIETSLEPAARLAVLLHEAPMASCTVTSTRRIRGASGVCETEAESTAYVLANLLDLDVDASSISYIAGWSHADASMLTAAATNVPRAVNTVARRPDLSTEPTRPADRGRRHPRRGTPERRHHVSRGGDAGADRRQRASDHVGTVTRLTRRAAQSHINNAADRSAPRWLASA
jgi:hypothetical protein